MRALRTDLGEVVTVVDEMSEFDWPAAIDETLRAWQETPPGPYPPIDHDHNRVAWAIPTEMLDRLRIMREINERMTEAFLEATERTKRASAELLGDLDSFQPIGLLARDHDRRNARAMEWWRSQRRG